MGVHVGHKGALSKLISIIIKLFIISCRFMSIGGWAVLNKWLSDGKKTDNFTIIIELLEVKTITFTGRHITTNST